MILWTSIRVYQTVLEYAQEYDTISEDEIDIIIYAEQTIIYHEGTPWKKKHNDSLFDVTMGSCELVVCFLLSKLHAVYGDAIGLYRDDGLGTQEALQEKMKTLRKVFADFSKRTGSRSLLM